MGDLGPEAPQLCHSVVQPGLQSGSMYLELLVQSVHPSSRGWSVLTLCVVSLGCFLALHCAMLPLCDCCPTLEVLEVNLCGGHRAWGDGMGAAA